MPLSIKGVSAQILSSLGTYKNTEFCTINDCKVVINHLVRKFSEPLSREGGQQYFESSKLKNYAGNTVDEHAIPVNEIMNHLFKIEDVSVTEKNIASLSSFLKEALIIVTVTVEEDAILNSAGLQRSMPSQYHDSGSELFGDPWARYKITSLYENIMF